MNNALLYLGGLLVVVLTALFAVPLFIDWNGYRGVFEEEASKVMGRDVRVGGDVNVRFLPTPYVRFEKVRLADPTGQTGESFIRADSFTMWLSGPALLRGVLEANVVELTKPILTLALDGKGSGNWASLQLKPAALPFVPQDVSLKSVKLIDGTLALYNPNAEALGKIENINGELAADALDGPFRFRGTVLWSGEDREIKLVTDKPAADGSFRIKANARSLKAVNSYTLDGRIENLSSTPKFTGEMTARLPSPGGPASDDVKTPDPEKTGVDFKSSVVADATGAKFNDISLSLENAAEPQIITGQAVSGWAAAPRLDVVLASKWLDVDKLVAAGQDTVTFPRLKQLALSLMGALAGDGAAAVRLDVDQIKMGGETAGGLKIDAERTGGDIRVRRLNAGLPGGSRLSVSGNVKDDAGKVTFAGSGSIHGTNVARLLSWAAKSGANIDIKGEGPFSADGQIVISDTRFELKEAAAELNGRSVAGELIMSDEGRRRIAVSLEGAKFDTAEFFPGTAIQVETQIRRLFGLASKDGGAAGKAANAEPAADTVDAAASDIELRLLTAELKHGNQIFNSVDARFALDGGDIKITRADFTTPAGLKVGIEGQVTKAQQASGRGTLAYELQAKDAKAAEDIAAVFGLGGILAPARLAALGPGQVAGLVHIGTRAPTAADITVEGTVNGAEVSGQAIFENGFGTWRSAPSSATFKFKAQDPGIITGLIGLPLKSAEGAEARPTEVVIASSGPLASSAAALVSVKSAGLDTAFNGRAVWPDGGTIAFDGLVDVKARDVQELLALAGFKVPGGLAGTPVEGQISVKGERGTWTLASRQIAIGNSTISGTVGLVAEGESKVSGDIVADRVTIPALLSALSDKAAPAPEAGAETASIWPEQVFNFDVLKGINGSLDVRFGVLDITGALSVHDGALKLSVAPGTVRLTSLTGRAAGGTVDARASLEAAPAGVGLQAALKISNADLAVLAPRASGRATLDVSANGRAQSPAGVVAALTGSGTIAVEAGVISGPSPNMVTRAANQVLQDNASDDPEALQSALETALATSVAKLGTREIAVSFADGTVKVEPVSLEGPDGRAQVTATADLMSMRFDGHWQVTGNITPLPPPADVGPGWAASPPKGPLPPASIVYAGRLDDLKSITVTVNTGELQRELTVRQMERNVEELERLRRRDEDLARKEQERRKAIEAEKAAAAAAAKAEAQKRFQEKQPAPAGAAEKPLPPVLPQSNATGQPDAGTAAGNNTLTVVPLTVEPIDAEPASAEAAPQQQAAPPPRPAPRVQQAAPRPPQRRRSTSDEVLRSLGGVP